MNLRPYQSSAIEAVKSALHNRPVLAAPTGSGKTVMMSSLVRDLDCPTLWLVHRRELVAQAAAALRGLGLSVGLILAGEPKSPRARVQVAAIQTLARREFPPAELIVIDESHHATARTYRRILSAYPNAKILGGSATPFRLDGKGLGDVFGEIVVAATARELIELGFLVKPVTYAPAAPDLSNVNIQAGDFNLGELGAAMTKPKLVGDIVETWVQRAHGRRTVCFAVNIEHSRAIVDAFNSSSSPGWEHLDGTTPKWERDGILARLRSGRTVGVSNCMVLTEGWDLPALEVAIVARPTASLNLHLQMLGRIMRAAPEKLGAIVLDHAGNTIRHGQVDKEIAYSLDGYARDKEPASNKTCPGCYMVIDIRGQVCPGCGHVFGGTPREITHVPGELVEFQERPRPSLPVQQEAWAAIESQRKNWGYKEGWSYYRFADRFGFKPTVFDGEIYDPATCGISMKHRVFDSLSRTGESRGYKSGWAAHQYRQIFGVWPRFKRTVDVEAIVGRMEW